MSVDEHGFTPHGHPCCGEADPTHTPTLVARCGGPDLCAKCSLLAARMHTVAWAEAAAVAENALLEQEQRREALTEREARDANDLLFVADTSQTEEEAYAAHPLYAEVESLRAQLAEAWRKFGRADAQREDAEFELAEVTRERDEARFQRGQEAHGRKVNEYGLHGKLAEARAEIVQRDTATIPTLMTERDEALAKVEELTRLVNQAEAGRELAEHEAAAHKWLYEKDAAARTRLRECVPWDGDEPPTWQEIAEKLAAKLHAIEATPLWAEVQAMRPVVEAVSKLVEYLNRVGEWRCAGGEIVEEHIAAIAGAYQAPADGTHAYLSWACYHAAEPGRKGLHGYCQTNAIRWDGTEKVPAQCKFCPSPCICGCHRAEGVTP